MSKETLEELLQHYSLVGDWGMLVLIELLRELEEIDEMYTDLGGES